MLVARKHLHDGDRGYHAVFILEVLWKRLRINEQLCTKRRNANSSSDVYKERLLQQNTALQERLQATTERKAPLNTKLLLRRCVHYQLALILY